ncbi:MAG: AbrB/MazE/SpoVT family DNA-binding domain-containing protein [Verrucomicrobiales bacterium]|nr:AbrB/MazE/SpoVT family DNA-binding domain-containing protein [Verrucomicrobiales bacterium]
MKTETIQMDKAGRVVLPKPLREQFNLLPGDKLKLSVEGNSIRLQPSSGGGELVRKGTVLVFTGEFAEPVTNRRVEDMLAQEREASLAASTGKLRGK